MIERQLILVTALLLTLTAACKTNHNSTTSNAGNSHPAPTASLDQFAAVRPIYEKECQSCHGPTGAGGPVKLEDGTKLKVPTLREGRAVRHDDAEFGKQIMLGGDGMPAFEKKLSTDQKEGLIKMIRVEFQGK